MKTTAFTPKRMNVWNVPGETVERLVIGRARNGSCVSLVWGDEGRYELGLNFETINWAHSEDLPEKRYMSRDEVLRFLAETPGVLVYRVGKDEWNLPGRFGFHDNIDMYRWRTKDGVVREFLA